MRDADFNDLCRTYNDWPADYCAAHPVRLKGVAASPLRSIPDCVAEAERGVARHGLAARLFGL